MSVFILVIDIILQSLVNVINLKARVSADLCPVLLLGIPSDHVTQNDLELQQPMQSVFIFRQKKKKVALDKIGISRSGILQICDRPENCNQCTSTV